jgi:hypothetical protein
VFHEVTDGCTEGLELRYRADVWSKATSSRMHYDDPAQQPYSHRARRLETREMIVLAAALLIVAAADPPDAVAGRAARAQAAGVCLEQRDAARNAVDSNAPAARAMVRDIDRALALFRFHRRDGAIAAIAGAKKRLDRSPGLFAADSRAGLASAVAEFASCLSSAAPPPMARLTIRARQLEDKAGQVTERAAGAGVYLRVEGIPVGRTSEAGVLRAPVPSGDVYVEAIVPPNAWGEGWVTLTPGGTGTVAVTLDPDKEPTDETDLVLVEAHDGVLHANAPSLSLRFVEGNRPVGIARIEAIERLDSDGNVTRDLTGLFHVSGTAMVAADARAVIAVLAGEPSVPVRVRVTAVDRAGFGHWNEVEFRIPK